MHMHVSMKAQMSFEFMLYSALAGMSLLFAFSAFGSQRSAINSYESRYEAQGIIDSINNAVLSMGGPASVSAYIPGGMCNSTIYNYGIRDRLGAFYLAAKLKNASFLCPDSAMAVLDIEYANSTIVVKRE